MATSNHGYFIRQKTKPPCVKDCKDRHQLCHLECEPYKEWKNGYDDMKKELENYKHNLSVIADYKSERTKNKKER